MWMQWNLISRFDVFGDDLTDLVRSGVDFNNMFAQNFCVFRSQKQKNAVKSSVFFCSFGICIIKSAIKAARKTLVKSIPGTRINTNMGNEENLMSLVKLTLWGSLILHTKCVTDI